MRLISGPEFVTLGHQGAHILYLCDWLQFREQFSTLDIGAVVTDPPYGMHYRSNHNTNNKDPESWGRWRREENFEPIRGDNEPFNPRPLLGLSRRVAICGGNHFADLLPRSRGWIVWDKLDGLPPSHQSDCELVWTNQDKPLKIFRWLWRGIVRKGRANVSRAPKLHPNQKPVELMAFILDYLKVPEGSIVFDPYMGSGSTGEACALLGYQFIGCDIERWCFDVSRERLSGLLQQPRML